MPYLHWERTQDLHKLNAVIEKAKALEEPRELIGVPKSSGEPLTADEDLLYKYFNDEHPIHCRRTLDQYYYRTLSDTSRRDRDQTPMRYFNSGVRPAAPDGDEVTSMVDQLWMWVLPPCGRSPATVITAFPQRSFRAKDRKATALLSNIIRTFSGLRERSCHVLAEVIASECCKAYLESKSSWHKRLQFLEIYTSSLAKIVTIFIFFSFSSLHSESPSRD
jgi:hypothetical protein